jgi:retinoid hydroxylase
MLSEKSPSSYPLPPGSFGLPIIGETLSFLIDPNFQTKRIKKYGKIFKTNIFGNSTVVMIGNEANTFLFKNENKYVCASWPKTTKELLGPGALAVQQGTFHTSRRKLLYQAFQPRALENYIPTIENITNQYLIKWEKEQTLTWYPQLRNYTFDIASSLFVGEKNGSNTTLMELFETWLGGLFSLPINLPWTQFGKAKKAREKLLKYIEKIILARQKSSDFGQDALGLLLQAKDEEGNSLSLAELKDQILLLLFAGHETLTSAITSFCLLTAQHPEVKEKIRQEQEKLGISKVFTLENLKEMTYLEQVLKEVLRFVPPVGGGFRETIETFTFNGYLIPQGWSVQYNIKQTHQDTEIYDNPDKFDSDRFDREREENKQKSFSYIPFGGGLRECLGKEFARLEMKILAAMLVRNYDWELLPNQNLEMKVIPTPIPQDGLKINFIRR